MHHKAGPGGAAGWAPGLSAPRFDGFFALSRASASFAVRQGAVAWSIILSTIT
jgi:hypothetical protein